jgi:rhamnose utilization protein RhaD (predicted bifunctional aldolase and dehydrogenase)
MREHDNLADDLLTDAAKGLGKEGGGFWSSAASESQRQRAVRIAPYRRGAVSSPDRMAEGLLLQACA